MKLTLEPCSPRDDVTDKLRGKGVYTTSHGSYISEEDLILNIPTPEPKLLTTTLDLSYVIKSKNTDEGIYRWAIKCQVGMLIIYLISRGTLMSIQSVLNKTWLLVYCSKWTLCDLVLILQVWNYDYSFRLHSQDSLWLGNFIFIF